MSSCAKSATPRNFNFQPLEHDEIGAKLGLMDFERAAKISGARFVVLIGALARLERAISRLHARSAHDEFGYREISPPLLVRDEAAYRHRPASQIRGGSCSARTTASG